MSEEQTSNGHLMDDLVRKLLKARQTKIEAEEAYQALRNEVYDSFYNGRIKSHDCDGFRITLREDGVKRELKVGSLREALCEFGLSEDEASAVISASKIERETFGSITIKAIAKASGD